MDAREVECRSPLSTLLAPEEAARTANVFRALSNPHRVQLMGLLGRVGEPVCVCDLTQALGLAQSTISHHLKQLVGAGLLQREQRGLWAYYSVDPDAVELLRDVLEPAVLADVR
jgi:ArsR family transcriptional regulator